VQGCGKSHCAKAVAAEWEIPHLRHAPGALYQKYYGETEKSLARAMRAAESIAPVVLWIDEIEKALGHGESDGGTGLRIVGGFLTWLQEKPDGVFVVATANDVTRLPPELLRKGRFDEIFFVDLPEEPARAAIFTLHLARRGRDASAFDVEALASATEGFSGAEIEQVIVSALYTAFARDEEVTQALLEEEVRITRPLAVTMREKIEALREWARDRTVPAG
jgi:SpoVK/Ycf46/Vps4 family AAA+-type ATPase